MNEYQKKLAITPNNQMPKDELLRIVKLVADTKRFGELLIALPKARDEFISDSKKFLEKYNLDLDSEEMKFIFFEEYEDEKTKLLKDPNYLDLVSESFFRYRQFYINKFFYRNTLREKICDPADEKVSKWRKRQINRCNGAIGGTNLSLIHSLFCFELARGCSVGCDFCGLGAKNLTEVYKYTDENVKIFRDVMTVVRDRFGEAGSTGMLYYATEPLDNPDYEKFEHEYYDIFGVIPQITTAAATRNIERTKNLIDELNKGAKTIHRFSLTSEEMAIKVFENFSPLELLKVELIPQYVEAPGFQGFTSSGHAYDGKKSDAGTISAIDGFCVNFCEKSVYLFTPVRSDEANPNGIHIFEKVFFSDGQDFKEKLNYLIDKYMINELGNEDILKLYDYFETEKSDENCYLVSRHGGEKLDLNKPMNGISEGMLEKVIAIILMKSYNKIDIAKIMYEEHGVMPEVTLYIINQLWKNGYIVEKYLA
ncbi:MAG: radical SAM family RiPP maturation amino acid epimerase [Lachnospiraceae bacterium]|nr:radical SAM family RiPP maturation amino acid epimerase [Lachnospiraceae bacterium]